MLTCRCDMLCRICVVHIQPRKRVLDHSDDTAPTPQRELDHTDQEYMCPEDLDHDVGIDDLSHL